jgi:hypothetical protein
MPTPSLTWFKADKGWIRAWAHKDGEWPVQIWIKKVKKGESKGMWKVRIYAPGAIWHKCYTGGSKQSAKDAGYERARWFVELMKVAPKWRG